MSTIKEVAARAGVSIATVSYVLNNSRPVKPETRERVLEAAQALGYVPNVSARNLRITASKSVGIILPNIQDALYASIFTSLSSYLQNNGYIPRVAFSNDIPEQEQKSIIELVSMNIDGLLLITCQPEQTEFFQQRVADAGVPTVFIERAPTSFATNFIGFNSYQAAYRLVTHLLEKGYRKILLACGPLAFSPESNCLQGYQDALATGSSIDTLDGEPGTGTTGGEPGTAAIESLVLSVNMNKEDAFRDYLEQYADTTPDAVICTSREIEKGITAAARYCGLRIPEDLLVITFGEESWNNIQTGSGTHQIPRPAMQLGDLAAQTMIRSIEQPELNDLVFCELEDTTADDALDFPDAAALHPYKPARGVTAAASSSGIRILIVDTTATQPIISLTRNFTDRTGIPVTYDVCAQEALHKKMREDYQSILETYDLFTYNSPWRDLVASHNCLTDLSDFVSQYHINTDRFFSYTLDNCLVNGKLYGIPFTAASQILFYRSDFFQNPAYQKAFSENNTLSLRPPRTWTEFNNIAAFFTRAVNPDAPTVYGTSFTASSNEFLGPELLIRMFSYGGALWDAYNHPTFYSSANLRAFDAALTTLQYVSPDYTEKDLDRSIEDFCSGETAMLISFSDHAHLVSRLLRQNQQAQIGAYRIPGNKPVRGGFSFGVNPQSLKRREAFEYLNWFCRRDTSFYLTVLNGASPFIEPYHNFELQKLYPWLAWSEQSIAPSIPRHVPHRKGQRIIPTGDVMSILCDAFRAAADGSMTPEEALIQAQEQAEQLYRQYGYPIRKTASVTIR
ncbi:MAG: extracellular solute-binding protein [Eubacterium sp.]|nr:extracellular solute-binding protein [Eubacterium sp.]